MLRTVARYMPHENDLRDRSDGRIEVRADWARLANAFSDDSPGVRWYLHLRTGEVVRLADDDEAAARFAELEGYVLLERARSKEQYRWMERFIIRLSDRALAAELSNAIAGKRAFQRFKVAIAAHPAHAAEWYQFRSAELSRHMRGWLDAHNLVVPWQSPPPPLDDHVERDASSRDALLRGAPAPPSPRARLAAVTETLHHEDVASLLEMAEFLLANAQARYRAGSED